MKQFLSGSFTVLALVAALYFLRFYMRSRDRLFACFAACFFMLGIERVVITIMSISNESAYQVTSIRLVALVLILWAIIDKNRRGQQNQDR